MKTLYRQGDVLFKKVKAVPPGTHKKRATGHILEGEATGHVHRIAELDQAEVLEVGEGLFLSVSDAGVSIVHEEHHTINLPAGTFEVIRQREYAPDAIRNVVD
jgi:hypothetical protein